MIPRPAALHPAHPWAFWAFLTALALLTPGLLHPQTWSFLSGVDLIFHEAGHVLFMPFGETLYLMGGSLFQVLLPLALAGVFLWRGEGVSCAALLLWTAQSLGNVSVYVADAQARLLPLLGDDPDSHDWWQLLGSWNALAASHTLGNLLWFLSIVTALAAVWTAYIGTRFGSTGGRNG